MLKRSSEKPDEKRRAGEGCEPLRLVSRRTDVRLVLLLEFRINRLHKKKEIYDGDDKTHLVATWFSDPLDYVLRCACSGAGLRACRQRKRGPRNPLAAIVRRTSCSLLSGLRARSNAARSRFAQSSHQNATRD